MVPFQHSLKRKGRKNDEHHEGDDLLNDFQLNEGEVAAVPFKPNAVGGHLKTVLEKSNQPTEDNDAE